MTATVRSIPKDLKPLARRLRREYGWTVVNGGKHLKWIDAEGRVAHVSPCSPSSGKRAQLNTIADIRRAARARGIEL